MYSNKKDSMTITVHLYQWHQKTDVEALLDSGTTNNFIDQRTVTLLNMGTKALHQPREVRNIDGTPNQAGSITHYCNLWVRQGSKKVQMGFYVANLGRDRLILGHPWFQNFNPIIDWVHNTLIGDEIHIETVGYLSKKENPISELNTVQSPQTIPTN
jgi:hypothetical protein